MRWPFRLNRQISPVTVQAEIEPVATIREQKESTDRRWNFEAGVSIAEGRTVLKRLGGGSANEVFLVWDERLFALLVAKLLRPHRVSDERSLRELKREAELLERLVHPTLVRGFGAVLEGPHPHLLLEVVEGDTLSRLIKREGALHLHQVLPVALHIAAVLHYLALEGIVHLDVKPGNIVMGIPPRLIDLSIARSTEEAANLRSTIGTDPYMAPEQCDPIGNPQRLGPPADIFGLGASLYHAVSGRQPFPRPSVRDSDDLNARFPQLLEEPDPLPRHLPADLSGLILQMLDKDPEKRPTAREVAAALEPLVIEVTTPRRRR